MAPSSSALAASITLTPEADTFVRASGPSVTHGAEDASSTSTAAPRRMAAAPAPAVGLLRFDLGSIPSGATITGASLELTSLAGFAFDGDPEHHASFVPDDSWVEGTVTWNTRPADGLVAAAAAGGVAPLRQPAQHVAGQPGRGVSLRERRLHRRDAAEDSRLRLAEPQRTDRRRASRRRQALPRDLLDPLRDALHRRLPERPARAGVLPPLLQQGALDPEGPAAGRRLRGGLALDAEPDPRRLDRRHWRIRRRPCRRRLESAADTGGLDRSDLRRRRASRRRHSRGPARIGDDGRRRLLRRQRLRRAAGRLRHRSRDGAGVDRRVGLPRQLRRERRLAEGARAQRHVGNRTRPDRRAGQGALVPVRRRARAADPDRAVRPPGRLRPRACSRTSARRSTTSSHRQTRRRSTQLSAEFAPSAFRPSAFSPSAFSPSAFSPRAFSPSAFSPSAFSPSVFSPSVFSPSAFSPSAFSPSVFSPSAFSPSAFSPSAFSPSAFSPSVFSPTAFSPEEFAQAFSSAQTRSLIAVSATPGTANEIVVADTWSNTGSLLRPRHRHATARSTRTTSSRVSVAKRRDRRCAGVTDTTPSPRGRLRLRHGDRRGPGSHDRRRRQRRSPRPTLRREARTRSRPGRRSTASSSTSAPTRTSRR